MTLHEISKIAKEGDKVIRESWEKEEWAIQDKSFWKWPLKDMILTSESALADDWEIMKKKVKRHEEMTMVDLRREGCGWPRIPAEAKVSIEWEEEE